MTELIMNKIVQAILFLVGWVLYMWAEAGNPGVGFFQEAAKYGIAVLVLCIVLFVLFKEYKQEKDASKEEIKNLNKLITEMVDGNRQALNRSTQAIESVTEELKKSNSINERLMRCINDLRRGD